MKMTVEEEVMEEAKGRWLNDSEFKARVQMTIDVIRHTTYQGGRLSDYDERLVKGAAAVALLLSETTPDGKERLVAVRESDLRILKHPTSRGEFAGGYLFQEAMERLTKDVEF